MQTTCKELGNPTPDPVGKTSYFPSQGGTRHPEKQKPFVSCPASLHFGDIPGMAQGWAHRKQHACVHPSMDLLTPYYVPGTNDTAVNEAGVPRGRRQRQGTT